MIFQEGFSEYPSIKHTERKKLKTQKVRREKKTKRKILHFLHGNLIDAKGAKRETTHQST